MYEPAVAIAIVLKGDIVINVPVRIIHNDVLNARDFSHQFAVYYVTH